MRLSPILFSLIICFSCQEKQKITAVNKSIATDCDYNEKTWLEFDEEQKSKILNSRLINQNIISVLKGEKYIIDGTTEKQGIIRSIAYANCNHLPLYLHFTNLILSDSILIYTDTTKINHYTPTSDLGYPIIKLFKKHPKEMFNYVSKSPENNYNISGALIAGFYEKSLNLISDIPTPVITVDELFTIIEENVDFETNNKKEFYKNFKIDIEQGLWEMHQEH
ncbi:hypothetical protein [uncultured Croceitalea sp.]|uniref:hypothetical protein n=1 Tax=uncultured Croceitalea sp. TaxID=1798908 RepID=UPI003305D871